ncbi:MAG: CoA pyrophosphatase [Elusimicrobia bacterium]|nr:CoA pyrophosphatase [Elusimicrobiota bacterium]
MAVILAPGAKGKDLLLIRRSEHPNDPWSGQMGLPGGRAEPGDADAMETAIRETREETAIRLRRKNCLGALEELRPRGGDVKVVVSPFVFELASKPAVKPSVEVAAEVWVPVAELAACRSKTEVSLAGRMLCVDAFLVGPYTVWGLTYRILTELLDA